MMGTLVRIVTLAACISFWDLYLKSPYRWLLNYLGYAENIYLNLLGYLVPLVTGVIISNALVGSGEGK